MKQVIALLTVIALLLFSCKDDEKTITIVQGTVINIGSKEPVDSVMVVAVDGAESDKAQMIKYTDSLGKFSVSVEGYRPCIYLVKDGYRFVVFSEGHGSSDNFKTYAAGGTFKNEMLELWADAYFKGVFKGISCLNSDSIYFDEGSVVESIDNLRSRNIWWFGNGPFSPYYAWKGIGDTYFTYWMKYQVHGKWKERLDSVYIPSFTTYTDTIYY